MADCRLVPRLKLSYLLVWFMIGIPEGPNGLRFVGLTLTSLDKGPEKHLLQMLRRCWGHARPGRFASTPKNSKLMVVIWSSTAGFLWSSARVQGGQAGGCLDCRLGCEGAVEDEEEGHEMISMMRDKAENAIQISPSRSKILKSSTLECNIRNNTIVLYYHYICTPATPCFAFLSAAHPVVKAFSKAPRFDFNEKCASTGRSAHFRRPSIFWRTCDFGFEEMANESATNIQRKLERH